MAVRMWRWALNLTAILSLALAIAAGVFWVRSQWFLDSATIQDARSDRVEITTRPGTVDLVLRFLSHDPNPVSFAQFKSVRWGSPIYTRPGSIVGHRQIGIVRPAPDPEWAHRGFGLSEHRWSDNYVTCSATAPFWFITLTTLVLPSWISVRFLRRERRAEHRLCRRCGYDLRATPDRCPECGMVTADAGKVSN